VNKDKYPDGIACEYDDYKMPAYDPSIPPDERARRMEELDKNLADLIAQKEE
jgi:hypothetical protein